MLFIRSAVMAAVARPASSVTVNPVVESNTAAMPSDVDALQDPYRLRWCQTHSVKSNELKETETCVQLQRITTSEHWYKVS